MFKSIRYVLKENFTNLYRIYCISKYELLSDMRDSRLGVFWNFANPAIQIMTYYFVFGLIMNRKAVGKIPFIQWMLCGMVVWFLLVHVLLMVPMPFMLNVMSLQKWNFRYPFYQLQLLEKNCLIIFVWWLS